MISASAYLPWLERIRARVLLTVIVEGCVLPSTSSEISSVWRFIASASACLPSLKSTWARLLIVMSVKGCVFGCVVSRILISCSSSALAAPFLLRFIKLLA